jgi:type IV pilus assembly protein PilA
MKNNRKGFTLVELLAVIVILAIILAIAVPSISSMIANSKKNSFEANVKMIITSISYKLLEGTAIATSTTENLKNSIGTYGANPADYESFYITSTSPTITISLTGVAGGKFGTCTVTGATRSNLTFTGTAGTAGVISGC